MQVCYAVGTVVVRERQRLKLEVGKFLETVRAA
jgi:hypothetical protein